MSDPEGLLDTSAVLTLRGLQDTALLPDVALISAVTLAKLSVGPLVASDDAERARRQAHLQQAEADFDPIPFRRPSRARLRAGRGCLPPVRAQAGARSFDAMIAATAIANGLPLYTANPADFAGIDDLVVRAVPTPDVES